VLVWLVTHGRLGGLPLLYAVVAGLLSSVVPYAADLTALRYVPARFFGVFMSCHPVLAAFAGLVLLGQVLALHEWVGIALVVGANAAAVTMSGPSPGSAASRRGEGARRPARDRAGGGLNRPRLRVSPATNISRVPEWPAGPDRPGARTPRET
jgi:inner membrane transporter RhtA